MSQFCPYLWRGTATLLRCPNCDCEDGPDPALAQGMLLREDSRSEAEAEGQQPGPKDAP